MTERSVIVLEPTVIRVPRASRHTDPHGSALLQTGLEAQTLRLVKKRLDSRLKARARSDHQDDVVREGEILDQLPTGTQTPCGSFLRADWRVRLKSSGDSGSPWATPCVILTLTPMISVEGFEYTLLRY